MPVILPPTGTEQGDFVLLVVGILLYDGGILARELIHCQEGEDSYCNVEHKEDNDEQPRIHRQAEVVEAVYEHRQHERNDKSCYSERSFIRAARLLCDAIVIAHINGEYRMSGDGGQGTHQSRAEASVKYV